jgi:DNA-binding transcriptional LysR family regulator
MISRTQMRQFLAVVDAGNFTRAASQLNIAQPTLSAGISELERQLGTRLFIRERKRIRLAEAGNHLLPLARSIERDFHLAEQQISRIPAPARPIRVGLGESLLAVTLEQGLAAYRGSDPVELIEGNATDLAASLHSGGLDLAIVNLERFSAQFECVPLFNEGYGMALPATHALADAVSLQVAAVAGDTMIARRSCEYLNRTSKFFTEQGVRPRFSLRSSNEERVMAMVRVGIGITVAPKSYACSGVTIVDIDGLSFRRTIGFALGPHWVKRTVSLRAFMEAYMQNEANPVQLPG